MKLMMEDDIRAEIRCVFKSGGYTFPKLMKYFQELSDIPDEKLASIEAEERMKFFVKKEEKK